MGTACVLFPWVDKFLGNNVYPWGWPLLSTPPLHGAPSLTSLLFDLLNCQGSLNPLVNLPCASCFAGDNNELPERRVSLPTGPTHCCSQLGSP